MSTRHDLLLAAALCWVAPHAVAEASAAAEGAPVTFSEHVAPILYGHCTTCHRPGTVAPMSLLSYREARPWAKSIARVVEAGDMPPWSPESDHVQWRNDLSLSADERATLVRWAQAGAPEGDPGARPPQPVYDEGWTLGEPDLVLTLDPVEVPADGPDLFPKQWLDLDLDETRWVRAIEFLPGEPTVTHHFQATYSSPQRQDRATGDGDYGGRGQGGSGIFGIWTAGMPPYVFPEGMGRVLTPGTRILMDSHYHPVGVAATDVTRIGVYFGEGELEKEVATLAAVDTGIRIPPGAPHHEERAFYQFDKAMSILAFSPHMHVRGKAMKYVLEHPGGEREVLLDVPRYDYNWQWLYYPTEPIDVPAGSRLVVTAAWDNSEQNLANPDPDDEILYRGDTFHEMFVGFFEAIERDGVYHEPRPAPERLADLVAAHPAEGSFLVKGFFPFSMHAPRSGEGKLYLTQGAFMFTISLDDIRWSDDRLLVTTQFPTPEASATTTLIEGELDAAGRLVGTLTIGSDAPKPLRIPFVGNPTNSPQRGESPAP